MGDELGNEPARDAADDSRRRFRRFPIEGTVRLYSQSAMWATQLVDLSLRGVMIERPPEFIGDIGQRFRLDIRLDGGVVIGMGTTLARAADDHLAFACQKIDFDSFTRLKRLVELNLGNTEVLNRELEAFEL